MKQLRRCPSSIFSLHSMYSTSIDWCMQIFVFSPSLPSFPQLQWDTHIHTHSYVCLSEKTEPLLSMDDDRTKAKRPAADRYFRRWFGSFILGGKVRFVVPSSFLFSILPKKSFLVRVFVCLSPPFFRPFYLALCGFGHFFFSASRLSSSQRTFFLDILYRISPSFLFCRNVWKSILLGQLISLLLCLGSVLCQILVENYNVKLPAGNEKDKQKRFSASNL